MFSPALVEEMSSRGLRLLIAERSQTCPYCRMPLYVGDIIAGHYGVRWGHVNCLADAYDANRLIESSSRASKRPPGLEDHLLRRPKTLETKRFAAEVMGEFVKRSPEVSPGAIVPQVKLKREWSDGGNWLHEFYREPREPIMKAIGGRGGGKTYRAAAKEAEQLKVLAEVLNQPIVVAEQKHEPELLEPQQLCSHFKPVQIGAVFMPPSMRPSGKTVMNEPGFEELLERVWKEQVDRKFSMYMSTTRSMPFCPVHQPKKQYVELAVIKYTVDPWTRYLWLQCRGDQVG